MVVAGRKHISQYMQGIVAVNLAANGHLFFLKIPVDDRAVGIIGNMQFIRTRLVLSCSITNKLPVKA